MINGLVIYEFISNLIKNTRLFFRILNRIEFILVKFIHNIKYE